MPIYDYLCSTCGPFEARRPMSESGAPELCTDCRMPAPRIVSAPRLNLMSSHNRYAETRNEKSAHEPDVVHTLQPSHVGGSHAHSKHQQHNHKHAHGRRAPARPWMLGH